MGSKFRIGDRVVKNPATWQVNDFDSWGRGEGVGVVMQAPFAVDDLGAVDVRWPSGRCFEAVSGLLPAPVDQAPRDRKRDSQDYY